MDNNELDKILREKLRNQITTSKELEQKIEKTIKEQKEKVKKETQKSSKDFGKMKLLISMVAVALIAFVVGITLNDDVVNFEEKVVTIATIIDIKPTKSSNEILARDSEFLIYAEGEEVTVESVQKALYIEPALEYNIEKTNKANEYKLTFSQNIPSNTIVKLQYVKDKITENSWAYQTANELSVSGTYPYNEAENVSKNTVIEVELSYATVENFEQYVEIYPAINGTWEHLGKVWRFTPQGELQEGKYYVKVKSGITAEQKTLKDDYTFEFTVGQSLRQQYRYNTISIDGINTYKPDEPVRIYCEAGYNTNELNISKVEIAKFKTKEDFIEYLQNKNYHKAENQGQYEFDKTNKYIQLTRGLQTGYYVAVIYEQNNKELFNCPVQINEISAYAISTERDVLVWVANGENLAQDIQVEYQGKIQKTNNQGLAEFKGVADDSETIKYLGVGNTSNKLVVGIYNYALDNYPNAYLYTDRPLYKNTDTINIWGFVPTNLFYDDIEEEFYIELNTEGKQQVKVEKDGNMNYTIDLKNHMDLEYALIKLYYKENIIATRSVGIENYEAQNYTYEIIYDKNYAYAGTKFEFDVKINHITGLSVPNKTITADYDGKVYRVASNESGIAHFAIEIQNSQELTSNPLPRTISIYNGYAEEYTATEKSLQIYVLKKDVYTKTEHKDDSYVATLYKIANDRNIVANYNLEKLYDGVYNTEVTVQLEETIWTRQIWRYKYNEYTKENEPEYRYISSKNTYNIKTVNTENGTIKVNTSELPIKQRTEEQYYNYSLIYEYKDQNGRIVRDTQYVYTKNDDVNLTSLGYYWEITDWESDTSNDSLWEVPTDLNSIYYYTYRYFLKCDIEKFSIGDTINFTLAESTANGEKDITNEGKILRIIFQEDISKKDVIGDEKFSYTFDESDFPGCKMTTAYFYKGNFYRMPIFYFDFNEEDRKVDIEITADKEQYKPGDEVTLTVKTTNNGKPVKTFVNLSVANEAVFELIEDTTNIIEQVYRAKSYPVYTYSSYIDYLEGLGTGFGGGGGDVRSNFGDTALFKTVYTDSNGVATITFKLPDNVTTYRVTAHSANEDLYLGVNTIDVVSTLDFFIQFTQPRNVKTTDDLVLNATSVANEKYDVQYEFTIKELNQTLTTTASTNSLATVNFGKLPYGTYTVTITGKYGEVTDTVEYEFDIIESAQEVKTKTTVQITDGAKIEPTKNPLVLEIYSKNMEQYLQYIEFVEKTVTTRLDTQIAYNKVQEIKDRYYNTMTSSSAINISPYYNGIYLKNLPTSEEDIILSALVSYYTDGYYEKNSGLFTQMDNLFESYLLAAANNEPVLVDLIRLKDEPNISNYNKLLVTISLEFLGDFTNARELYNTIVLTQEEVNEYKSIVAIIETFINKEEAITKINDLIANEPEDEYLRFAILSFFENNSTDIEKESEVAITTANSSETVKLNGMQVKTFTINSNELSTIKFETNSKDLMVSYYYQTLLDSIEADNISKDIKTSINGELKKGNTVKLVLELPSQLQGQVKIALPNSLRLAENYTYKSGQKYYMQSNQIDYAIFFKQKDCTKMEIPLLVTYEGNYKFENVVCRIDGIYHISNSMDLSIIK